MNSEDNDLPKDSEYLKQYVKDHPNNQMAWYLLGREYAAKGQEDKSKYCYAKAGEVYKVFEQIPRVEKPISNKVINAVKGQADSENFLDKSEYFFQDQAPQKRKSKLMSRSLILIAVILFLLYIPIDAPYMPSDEFGSEQNKNLELAPDPIAPDPIASDPMEQETITSQVEFTDMKVFYTVHESDKRQLEQTLLDIILPGETVFQKSLVVQAATTLDKKWILWTKQPRILLSAHRDEEAGKLDIGYYDAESCVCVPNDATVAKQEFAQWLAQQEQQLVLSSAIHAYEQLNNINPASIDDITQDYPNNILSGYTPVMAKFTILSGLAAPIFEDDNMSEDAAEEDENFEGSQNSNEEQEGLPLIPTLAETLNEPLEIIVDKQNHRLALVSGNVIIRNYPVGLGGDKTPEGEFNITEKVRNPNGRSDGDFGSRGMTLSDTLYAIHGTNEPESIGKDESLGCVRMLKEDIEELFNMAPKGTKVSITKDVLPEEPMRSAKPFTLPVLVEEINPNKVYAWLN